MPPRSSTASLRLSDLRALARLATEGTVGVSRLSEEMHAAVLSMLGVPRGPRRETRGLTGFVYASIRRIARLVGVGLERALMPIERRFGGLSNTEDGSFEREAVIAALNGVLGDHLAATANPLETVMSLRAPHRDSPSDRRALTADDFAATSPEGAVSRKVLVSIHGLCMNDLQWSLSARGGSGLGVSYADELSRELGYVPLFLRYNTGLHISDNGARLAHELEWLIERWPVPIDELAIIAHSMGGLVIRSAFAEARRVGQRWPDALRKIVFLGTPHHGAPLERGGNWVDLLLGASRFSAPFAKLGQLRSAGITDLRYGSIHESDWRDRDRFEVVADRREISTLPEGVACFAVAATTASEPNALLERTLGDGLVPLASALGEHADPRRTLAFPAASRWIAYGTNHLAMLDDPEIARRIVEWFGRASAVTTADVSGPCRAHSSAAPRRDETCAGS